MRTFPTVIVHGTVQFVLNIVNAKDGAWKIMASSKGGDDEQSQMFANFCVHVYTRTYTPGSKLVTRNKSYAKGKSMVVTTT